MKRSESKYYNTAARMDEAFLELLEKKDLAYITIKEICKKAGVNRSTFYLHYETINDLIEESVRYMIKRFEEAMPCAPSEFLGKMQICPLEELYLITPEYLTPYLNFVKEHRSIFRTALRCAPALRLNDAYLELNNRVFSPILNRFNIPSSEQKYMMLYYLNGLMGVINEWLKEDCEDSVEHMISVIQICIANCKR